MKLHFKCGRSSGLFGIIILLCLSSCLPNSGDFPVYYTIINRTESRISVEFHSWSDEYANHNNYPMNDTLVYYEPGEERILLVRLSTDNYRDRRGNEDSIPGISGLRIFRDDTIPVQKDYMLRKYWNLTYTSNYKSEMKLEITNESFDP
jgi:hypothetical protein